MPVWYTRQSSAEIVTDQVIEASDFNNEFNAIVTAFNQASSYVDGNIAYVGSYTNSFFVGTLSGSGHNHTGSDGEGPLLALTGTAGTTAVYGRLASKYGGVYSTTTNPTVNDDIDSTVPHVVGSTWVNTSTKTTFICTDNSNGAAVWQRLQGVSSGTAPATTNDISQGYQIGTLWYYTGVTPAVPYICVDNTTNAAVWVPLHGARRGTGTAAPTSSDSGTLGYREGSIFVDTAADQAYVNVDATGGAPVWKAIGESNWSVKTADYTIVNGDKILASTTSGSFGLVAPTATTADVFFEIADHDLTFDTNPVHLTGSIIGVTGTFVIDVKGFSARFVAKSSMFRIV